MRISTCFTLKTICYRKAAKTLSDFTNFPAMVLIVARNNICTAPFFDAQERHSWRTLKANVYIFLSRKIFFQRRSKILSGGGGGGAGGEVVWGRLNSFFKDTRCLSLIKCLTILEIQPLFSIEILPSIAWKRWNFPDNLDFKGKIVANFLIKIHLNNMTTKYQIKHGAIQKACHLKNCIFYPIQLCHTLLILLYHFPWFSH